MQKRNYDRATTDNQLEEGDLCMLKVEPRFRLDRQYKGPFHIQSLSTTNAVIKPIHDSNGEPTNVSMQRLSKTSSLLETAKPWLGHSGKLRCCRKIRRPRYSRRTSDGTGSASQADTTQTSVLQEEQVGEESRTTTRCGRQVKKPARFLVVADQMVNQKSGGSCKD